jgi:tRNA dimethylallyltransferase
MKLPSSLLRQCWFLAGPTACGKSATSLILADRLNAEIISLDSMAIYRQMDIGTAKPSISDRQKVAHHLIDIAEPHEEYSVAEFVRHAACAAEEIAGRGRVPLFVGGTGLYLRSILRGLSEGPEADWEFRRSMEQMAIQNGPEWLHDKLKACDPVTADRLHLNDMRRIIRALEVFELTGRPISEDQQHTPASIEDRPRVVVWLEPPRDWLRARIDLRVDLMMSDGWLEETRELMALHPPPSRTACQALGYRELIDHLNGQLTLEAAVEQIKISTRQFAKRQHTWFRNLEECHSVTISGLESPEVIADKIWALGGGVVA